MSFQDTNLHPNILKAVSEAGLVTPTPIQEQAIPIIMSGKDIRGSAQTGTGKTAAFLLPSLNMLMTPPPSEKRVRGPRVLILVPTRELAQQVATQAVKFSKFLSRVKTVCIYGGAPYPIQNRELSRPYEILVATPGRLIDHMEQGRINLSQLEMLILDEADHMLDMGFIDPVRKIAAASPASRQTLMFSATMKGNVLTLSNELLKNPTEINLAPKQTNHENIDQKMIQVDNINHKHRLLNHLLSDPTLSHAIVFTSTKHNADALTDQLLEQGFHAAPLHGDMNQSHRNRTITKFRSGQIRILVATDIAARGIDVLTVTHVINFDLPNCAEDYVHRIGRTGRAGGKGIAMSFAAPKDIKVLGAIEKFLGQKISQVIIPGFESQQKSRPQTFRPRNRPPQRNFSSRPRSRSGR